MSKSIYCLQIQETGCTLAVYSSLRLLKKGVEYWREEFSDKSMIWVEFRLNYDPEPLSFSWAYVAPNADAEQLGGGSRTYPSKKFWGKNLVNDNAWYDDCDHELIETDELGPHCFACKECVDEDPHPLTA